ncbi:hypothetical protein IQ06DRAFT_304840 [Phaeosphaeriaceae sp. SRC1lsM3a]|nr:hypothetical protein IQ06DRAFT_304840 [Stagonospora sp. SRC1lsM3a]
MRPTYQSTPQWTDHGERLDLIWECSELLANESFPEGSPGQHLHLHNELERSSDKRQDFQEVCYGTGASSIAAKLPVVRSQTTVWLKSISLAPSWSWACTDLSVRFVHLWNKFSTTTEHFIAEVHEVVVTARGSNLTGPISDACLAISGMLRSN